MITAEEMANLGVDKLSKAFMNHSLENIYNHEFHVKIGEELDTMGALPATFMSLAPASHDIDVWHDVNRMLTLNGEQSNRNVANHVCPLQFDIVNRLIRRYSNEGDLVYDPVCGLGTVPYCAIKLGRKGMGSELNTGYFFDSVHYLKIAEKQASIPDLFSFEEIAEVSE
jgi:DNA modification methylase